MKIEPGTLCVVRSTMPDTLLSGRIVLAVRWMVPNEMCQMIGILDQYYVPQPGAWGCSAPDGSALNVQFLRRGFFGNIIEKRVGQISPLVPMEAQYLIPISGPGLDLSEKWEREIEDDGDESGFKARRVARLAGDDSWD